MSNSIYCSCIVCKKEFSVKGIHSHYITAHTIDGNNRAKQSGLKGNIKGGQSYTEKCRLETQQKTSQYNHNPKLCKHCNSIIPYEKRYNNFCNSSCSASFTNSNRDYTKTKETWKLKFENGFSMPSTSNCKTLKGQIHQGAPYTRIYNGSCKHCNTGFIARKVQWYCNDCKHLYSHDGRAKYWFTFNVFHFPELFDLALITTYGFRDNKTNPNGITRDHKVSVNDAVRNNYDPYYIKHPMNCQLMFFNDNNKKKTKSSITYEEMIKLVDDFDKNGGPCMDSNLR